MPVPRLTLQNRQRRVRFSLPWLRRFAAVALPRCLATAEVELPEEIEVTVVSDRTIARVHLDFMGLPEPTDVITFHHGEIVISADTAAERAPEFGHSVEAELALYVVHGLLHLQGFDDTTSRAATRMHKIQDRIWQACLAELPAPH
jgi:probable rRNA maturation factor